MNVFSRTLMVGTFLVVAASTGRAQEAVATMVSECRDLTCFGRMAVNAKLLSGELKIPLKVYSQDDCTQIRDLVPAAYCVVIPRPRYEPEATAYDPFVGGRARGFFNWHSLKSWGAMFVGELYYQRQSINAVALANRAECDQINVAMEANGAVPCFRLDSLPIQITKEEAEQAGKR